MVVVGGARQQSDGKSRERAILPFQVSLIIVIQVKISPSRGIMLDGQNRLGLQSVKATSEKH